MMLPKIELLPETVQLPTSKSLANRWLVLQALFLNQIEVNVSDKSDDIEVLEKALISQENTIDVGHAGTAMRFLTAFLAQIGKGEFLLTGSERTQQRPIEPLVSALNSLGANIQYLNKEGFPPLKIKGGGLKSNSIEMDGSLSSQYISALLLIAHKLKGGLKITLTGTVVSQSYINLTVSVLERAGIEVGFHDNVVTVRETKDLPESISVQVESDWSAAAFWYGWVALMPKSAINLIGLDSKSSQGDRKLISFFEGLGVRTKEIDGGLRINHADMVMPKRLEINLINQPDLAQPLAVVCAILGVEVKLNGLQTLAIKETNRLEALKEELSNFGIEAEITSNSIEIKSQEVQLPKRTIRTYNDHRMAMSFSLFASRIPIEIEEAGVVSKSYPDYFKHLLKK
jgi:3-phosphoshikimate 1-carboxyvinyltransferase